MASRDTFPLLAELLAEQQRLDTPVARFATAHDQRTALTPQLIPLTAPGPGEQYAFEVDLDSCTGCKSCVAACHALNGLDDTETWRDVGLIVSSSRAHPFTQTVTSACHHCADPACLNGCPVLAYEKDPLTGIVAHLDDQCIGCSYCVLKCPYDVPKYSERLGIVRKCDMCRGRLAAGEAPACAQACPTHAIRIVTVPSDAAKVPSTAESTSVEVKAATDRQPVPGFLPAAPDPSYTRPTTRYVSRRILPDRLVAGDAATLRPQPLHGPLVVMLTLIPVAVAFSGLAAWGGDDQRLAREVAVGVGAAGLAASVFHLGQPRRAWRIFLGWRRSWLSREALVFGVWFSLAIASLIAPSLAPAAAVVGAVGLVCSAMIYVDTRRRFWRPAQTFPRFFGTGLLVALALVAPPAAAVLLLAKLAWEARTVYDGSVSARLQRGPLARLAGLRDVFGLVAFVGLLLTPSPLVLIPLVIGEALERALFFRAVDAPKMPGVPA